MTTGSQTEAVASGIPSFDEVHVISDLHFGGPEPKFQIFNQGKRLANTIEALGARPAASMALVLNGDVFDFLAENPPKDGLDVVNIVSKLQRIVVRDSAFSGVFAALRAFLAKDGRHVVFVLGNHDVELAFPQAREWLATWLAEASPEARGRLTFATEGSGFACDVGSKRVLCVHGNEVDEWNVVDHRQLLSVIRAMNRGVTPPSWSANAGTRMVIDVMNEIKKRFPVVDLLKPEIRAAIPVLAALDPTTAKAAGRVAGLIAKKTLDRLRMEMGFLNDGANQPQSGDLDDILVYEPAVASPLALDARLLQIQHRLDAGDDSSSLTGDEFLLWGDKASRGDMLRAALTCWLKSDRSHALDDEDDQFKRLDRIIGSGVHYLVAGHTHLRRAIIRDTIDPVTRARRYYFNTGTWIRLIELPQTVLDDPELFRHVYETFDTGTLDALDNARLGPNGSGAPLVKLESTVASIFQTGSGVLGALFDANDQGGLKELPYSRFP